MSVTAYTVPASFETDNLWHSIIAVGTGTGATGTITFYVDGVNVGTVTGHNNGTNIFAVGAYQGGGQSFAKKLDEVYLYPTTLTPAQVTALYQNGAQLLGASSSNVIPDSSAVTIAAGAFLDVGGSSETIGSLAGAGTVTNSIANSTFTLTTGADNTNTTFTGTIVDGSGTMTVVKTGTGTFTFSGTDSFTGGLSVQNGTFQLTGANNILSTGSSVVLGTSTTGGILDLGGTNQTLAGISTAGSGIDRVVNSGAGTPNLTLNVASAATFAGILGNAGQNSFGFVKTGSGSLLLSGANTFAGPVSVAAGILQMGSATALGSSSGSLTTVASGATLDLNGQTVDPTEVINIVGTGAGGVGGNGTLINNSGSTDGTLAQLFVNGSATIGGSRRFNILPSASPSVAGYIHSGTAAVPTTGTSFNLTKVGAAQDVIGISDDADMNNITVSAGELTFQASNSTGNTTGTISVANGAELLFFSGSTITNVKNVSLANGAILVRAAGTTATDVVNLGSTSTSTLTLSGTPQIQPNAVFNLSSALTDASGTGGSVGNLLVNGTAALDLLSTADNYTGGTTLAAGQTVILPTNAATAFGTSTTPITFGAGTLTGNGTLSFARNMSMPQTGALSESTAGSTMTVSGQIDLVSQGTVSVVGTGNVSITGNVVDEVTGNGFANGLIEGLVSNTNGTDFTDPNPGNALLDTNYTGSATIPFGGSVNFFRLGQTSQLVGGGPWDNNQTWAYTGQIFVQTTTIAGAVQSTTPVQFAAAVDDNTQVKLDGSVVLNETGDGFSTSGILNLTPGWHNIDVRFGNGGGGAGPNNTDGTWPEAGLSANGLAPGAGFGFGIQGVAGTGQTAKPITTAGDTNGTHYLDVVDAGDGLTFRHIAGGSVNMLGTGILTLSGGNTFHGPTTASTGTIVAASSSALGDPSGAAIANGGSLAIAPATTLTKQTITLTGAGSAGNAGALTTLPGASATYTGTIKGSGNFTVGAAANTTLTLTGGTIDLQNAGMTIGGAGNTVVNEPITTTLTPASTNTVTKSGSGTATLSGTNTYIGATSVIAGILVVPSASAVASTSGVLASGGTLELSGDFSLPSTPISIDGTGTGGVGALDALGNDSVSSVALAGNASIDAATAGKTLTINAITMGSLSNLTFTGAGNITVTTGFGNGPEGSSPGLSAQAYQGANAAAVAAGTGINVDGKPDDLLVLQTQQAPFVGLGSTVASASTKPGSLIPGTLSAGALLLTTNGVNFADSAGAGNAITTDHANDPFFSLTGATPDGTTNNQAEIYTGFITIPDTGYYTFFVGSDDGSNMWLDLNGNNAFSTGGVPDSVAVPTLVSGAQVTRTLSEQIVSNDNGQGFTTSFSAAILLQPGVYAVRIGDNNGGGNLGAIASWQETAGPGSSGNSFGMTAIPNSAFSYITVNNNVISNSTGTVTLLGNNTYNGTTTVNSGTFEVDGNIPNTAATTVTNATSPLPAPSPPAPSASGRKLLRPESRRWRRLDDRHPHRRLRSRSPLPSPCRPRHPGQRPHGRSDIRRL